MKYEDLKEELGDLIHECTQKKFEKGFDPIGETIDDYETNNSLCSLEQDKIEYPKIEMNHESDLEYIWEKTILFLEEMRHVTKGCKCYSQIYLMDYFSNSFFYSKEVAEEILDFWNDFKNSDLDGGKSKLWYYYFINREITNRYKKNKHLLDKYIIVDNIDFVYDQPVEDDWGIFEDED